MKNIESFEDLLNAAKMGNQEATESLLYLVSPIIKKNSKRGGKTDEDLKQYISMRIVHSLQNFIWDK